LKANENGKKFRKGIAVTPAPAPAPAAVPVRLPEEAKAWEKPLEGMVKLNVDVAFLESTGAAGAGMILRDAQGQIVFSSCRSLQRCGSALEAELCACLEGMSLALQWSQQDVLVEQNSAAARRPRHVL
jgi:hypothetical protein